MAAKKEIKAIVFDIGGVVTKPHKINLSRILSEYYKISLSKFSGAIFRKWDKMLTGKTSMKQYYRYITARLNIKDTNKFEKKWESLMKKHVEPNKEMQLLIKDIRKNYKIIAFTNVSKDVERIGIKKGIYDHFHIKVCSCNEGMKKPEKEFYKLLIKKSQCKPQELVFIDDSKNNLIPAQKLGIQTIHFKNASQLKKDLKNYH